MSQAFQLFAYIGPETIVPATSILAAIFGFLLAFGKMALQPFVKTFCWLTGRKPAVAPLSVAPADPAVGAGEAAQS